MSCYLKFDPLDQPTQLSKVGNWVITFIDPAQQSTQTQLAITYVIPRQANQDIHIRHIAIENTPDENIWRVIRVDAFNGLFNQELVLDPTQSTSQKLIQQILIEFAKYDVNISLISAA